MNLHKNANPHLKTLLAVGGATFKITKLTDIMASDTNRAKFVNTSIAFLRKYNFDGFDLDFESPGSGDSPEEDKERFTVFCKVHNIIK